MPGVNVSITNAPAPTTRPSETGKLFGVGPLVRGSTTKPIIVHSVSEFKAQTGGGEAGTFITASVETFFAEGGNTLILGRAISPTASAAGVNIKHSATQVATVKADSAGTWGNEISLEIIEEEAGAKFGVVVFYEGVEVEKRLGFSTLAEFQNWAEVNSAYIEVEIDKASENPSTLAKTKLSGGSNGAALTTANYETALKVLLKDLGCGQVTAFGVTTLAVQKALMAHAEQYNRHALVDLAASGATFAQLATAAAALGKEEGARRSVGFSTWANIAGLAPNTTRIVPWSAVHAGILARNDAATSPPQVNEASAGIRGIPRSVLSLVTEFTRAERDELNEKRINTVRVVPVSGIETYGDVTLVAASEIEKQYPWFQATAARLFMFVTSEGEQILEKFVFAEIDPHNLVFQRAGGQIQAFLESLKDQLFNKASEAVNVGNQVNTPETIKKKEIRAAILVQPSPTAEVVTLTITAQGV